MCRWVCANSRYTLPAASLSLIFTVLTVSGNIGTCNLVNLFYSAWQWVCNNNNNNNNICVCNPYQSFKIINYSIIHSDFQALQNFIGLWKRLVSIGIGMVALYAAILRSEMSMTLSHYSGNRYTVSLSFPLFLCSLHLHRCISSQTVPRSLYHL